MSFINIPALVEKIKSLNPEHVRREKLKSLFQVKNRVRSNADGREFTVCEVDVGSALLMDDSENVVYANWITSFGQIRTELANYWELVPATA